MIMDDYGCGYGYEWELVMASILSICVCIRSCDMIQLTVEYYNESTYR